MKVRNAKRKRFRLSKGKWISLLVFAVFITGLIPSISTADADDTEASPADEAVFETDPPVASGSIAGLLWIDGNGMTKTDWNGVRDPGEKPLAGYKVSIYQASQLSTRLGEATTDLDGRYVFEDLEPGEYVLGVGSQVVGSQEYLLPMAIKADNWFEIDWNSDPLMAFTKPIRLDDNQVIQDVDAGMRLPMAVVATSLLDDIWKVAERKLVKIDNRDWYVMKKKTEGTGDNQVNYVLLLLKGTSGSGQFGTSNSYSTSNTRTRINSFYKGLKTIPSIAVVPTLGNHTLTDVATLPTSEMAGARTEDIMFAPSYKDVFDFNGGKSNSLIAELSTPNFPTSFFRTARTGGIWGINPSANTFHGGLSNTSNAGDIAAVWVSTSVSTQVTVRYVNTGDTPIGSSSPETHAVGFMEPFSLSSWQIPTIPEYEYLGWKNGSAGTLQNLDTISIASVTSNIDIYLVYEPLILDLSETTASTNSYTISQGMDPYSIQSGGSPGNAVTTDSGGFRSLKFGQSADGKSYRIVQSGLLANPGNTNQPKNGTAIFDEIVIQPGTSVTLTLDSIDLVGRIKAEGDSHLNLLLRNESTYLVGNTDIGSFIRGGIIVPRISSTQSASLTIDDATGSGNSSSSLSIVAWGQSPFTAAIGGSDFQEAAGAITIAGGVVMAHGGEYGAAIGGAGWGDGGTIMITGGTVTAVGIGGAGIGGGQSGAGAAITIDAAATVKAYSSYSYPAYGDRPAIDPDGAGNRGTGFYVNAALKDPLAATMTIDLLVFPDGYSGGDLGDRIDTLMLPSIGFAHKGFAYTTGGQPRTDNLYIDSGYDDTIGRIAHRVIDRVEDDAKPVYSIQAMNGYDADNPAEAAGSGVLQVKLRQPSSPGIVSVDNIGQDRADLTSTGHTLGDGAFLDGGFLYATTFDALGRPDTATAVDLPWGSPAWESEAVTRNTTTHPPADPTVELTPNTRYHAITYLKMQSGLYLHEPPGTIAYQSANVASFVTLPRIVDGTARIGTSLDQAEISAAFDGGQEPLAVTIYWDTASIDPADPASWTAHNSVVPDQNATDYSYFGFTGVGITGLVAGETYNILIVVENETGYDYHELTYEAHYGFAFFKVDETGEAMAGVRFALYVCDDPIGAHHHGEVNLSQLIQLGCDIDGAALVTSRTDGLVEFKGLQPGHYLLSETETLEDYQLPQGFWSLTVDPAAVEPIVITAHSEGPTSLPPAFKLGSGDQEGHLLLPNFPRWTMPPLGGYGTVLWAVGGVLLIGFGTIQTIITWQRAARPLPRRAVPYERRPRYPVARRAI